MVERKMSNTPTHGQPFGQHPYSGPQYGPEHYGQEYEQYSDYPNHGRPATRDMGRPFSAAQGMSSPSVSVPASPSSGGFFPNPYGQVPNSPLHSPISPSAAPYDSQYNGQGQLLQPPQPKGPVSRVNSVASDEYDFTSHYVDLDRSSVTPFQAAQYAEISRRLNDNESNGQLLSVAEGEEGGRTPTIADFPAVPAATHYPQQQKRRSLTNPAGSEGPFADPQLQPPSPSFARERITSRPPMLPEIERGSGYDFPVSARGSPRTNSFVIPGPDAGGKAAGVHAPRTQAGNADRRRPDSVFTDDDAYGGI